MTKVLHVQPKSEVKHTLTSLAMILGEEEQRLGLTREAELNVHTNVRLQNKPCFWHKGP